MHRQCVVYTANAGYLFPALLSALQVIGSIDRSSTDVLIICVGDGGSEFSAVDTVCRQNGIDLRAFPASAIGGLHPMYARLFLSDLIDEKYGRALYIDSDTQIVGNLQPLFDAPLAPGRFMAVRDPMCLVNNDFPFPAGILENFERLGLSQEKRKNYFNSGVLMINMDGWRETSEECRERMAALDKPYKFPDQDVLNIIGKDKVDLVSMRWNFPAFLLRTVCDLTVTPRILHFMSNPRPWQGSFYPWGLKGSAPYRQMSKRYPSLAQYHPRLPKLKFVRYHLQQVYKAALERHLWDNAIIKDRVIAQQNDVLL